MSLSAFLAQNAVRTEHVLFAVSPRFVDEDGEAEQWEIRCLTAAEEQLDLWQREEAQRRRGLR